MLFVALREQTEWLQAGYANEDGRTVYLPRLTANYGEYSYDYSGLSFDPLPFTPLLSDLKELAEQESNPTLISSSSAATNTTFNALIVQLYRDGSDVVNWHADDSPRVGENPSIVSMSFGAARTFEVKQKSDPSKRLSLLLEDGDLLVMQGALQHEYLHRIKKEPGASERINLTFRKVVAPNAPVNATANRVPATIFRRVTL